MSKIKELNWPLMENNILREDLDRIINYLQTDEPRFTQGGNVRKFEREWSEWLGVEHSVFVNSGSSANFLTMSVLKERDGLGEVIVPPLTWVSDVSSIIRNNFKPVFVDISRRTLGMDCEKVIEKITPQTKAVFLTHILGYNALTEHLLNELELRGIPLIEDACESHGATFKGKKVGSFGLMSNFSFYYGHHMTAAGEGGMVSTNDPDLYQMLRMYRGHGLVRESDSEQLKQKYYQAYPNLNPDFIFAYAGYNFRSTEINAIMGRSQLKRLDENNQIRRKNLQTFLNNLDPDKYQTDFETEGSCNYALTLILNQPNDQICQNVIKSLNYCNVEYRLGTSGGGNQLQQPYLRDLMGEIDYKRDFPNVEHVHSYGFYIGNYPSLGEEKIVDLCQILNELKTD